MLIDIDVPDGRSDDWAVETFMVSQREADFQNLRARISSSDRPIQPGKYKRLVCGKCVVMSNTPVEVMDHWEFIRTAQQVESVLINGLGLGVALKAVLDSNTVKKVKVIEIAESVIKLVAPSYRRDPRVEIIHADAFEYKPPRGERYRAVWHDIWNDICADNLPEMSKLKRKYTRRTAWQGCWCEEFCRRGR